MTNANLLSFTKTIGLIIGTNIGTTSTAFLKSFSFLKLSSLLYIISILLFFCKKESIKQWAIILFAIAGLFTGLQLLEQGMRNTFKEETLNYYLSRLSSNKLLAIIIAMLATIALQSSSVFLITIQSLFLFSNVDLFICFVIGTNIGTTSTILILAFNGNKESKKVCLFHLTFNLIGAFSFIIFFKALKMIFINLFLLINVSTALEIAIIHLSFNLVSLIIVLLLKKQIVFLINKIIA